MSKILIIEDETLIARSLKMLLEKSGHCVTWTESGIEAIKLIQEEDFDRIVCDLMLQDISGFDILEEGRRIFTSEEFNNKFIIMTAYNSIPIVEKIGHYNCSYLQKPFIDIKEALRTINGDSI